jgi:hypothetical protein
MSQAINPNILYPTQKASIAGTPSESAYKQMQINNTSQNKLNASFKGGKQKKNKGGGYEAPQMVIPYNTSGTNPNTVIAGNTQIAVQGSENAKYDSLATQIGGNPNWNWGCYSGGKSKHRKTKHRKTKQRKTKQRKTKHRKPKHRKSKHRNSKTHKKH